MRVGRRSVAGPTSAAPVTASKGPQDVVYVDRHGVDVTATAHHTTGTLVWQLGGVTLRLEGFADERLATAAAAG